MMLLDIASAPHGTTVYMSFRNSGKGSQSKTAIRERFLRPYSKNLSTSVALNFANQSLIMLSPCVNNGTKRRTAWRSPVPP